jgi:hypothetical protein
VSGRRTIRLTGLFAEKTLQDLKMSIFEQAPSRISAPNDIHLLLDGRALDGLAPTTTLFEAGITAGACLEVSLLRQEETDSCVPDHDISTAFERTLLMDHCESTRSDEARATNSPSPSPFHAVIEHASSEPEAVAGNAPSQLLALGNHTPLPSQSSEPTDLIDI